MPSARPFLSLPSTCFEESYRNFVSEFHKEGGPLVPFTLNYPHDDFAALVRRLQDESAGKGIAEGFVPHSTYWLVLGEELIGVSDLRHRLNERLERRGGHIGYGIRPSERNKGYGSLLLGLTLEQAKEMGINKVLLTCGRENKGSAAVIARNGGVLQDEEYLPEYNERVCRYIISL